MNNLSLFILKQILTVHRSTVFTKNKNSLYFSIQKKKVVSMPLKHCDNDKKCNNYNKTRTAIVGNHNVRI